MPEYKYDCNLVVTIGKIDGCLVIALLLSHLANDCQRMNMKHFKPLDNSFNCKVITQISWSEATCLQTVTVNQSDRLVQIDGGFQILVNRLTTQQNQTESV